MRGCIIFSNGHRKWFTDDNYEEVIAELTETQKRSLVALLHERLGPKDILPYDHEAYAAWYEDVHRKNIMFGGGSGNSDGSKINPKGGKKYSMRDWKDKGDGDKNIVWLRNKGFKKRWDKEVGYKYIKDGIEVPVEWLSEISHELFTVRVNSLFVNLHE